MNRWVYEQNAMAACQEMRTESVVCPKPRRLVLQTPDNDPIRAHRWPLKFVNPRLIFFLPELETFCFWLCRFELESLRINFWYIWICFLTATQRLVIQKQERSFWTWSSLRFLIIPHPANSRSFILIDYLFINNLLTMVHLNIIGKLWWKF